MAGDIKLKHLASSTLVSSGLNSLAASSTRLSGYETDAYDVSGLTGGPPFDILLGGYFTAASSNSQAGQIDVWVIPAINDTPTWPDVFDGTGSTETATSANILNACGRLAISITGDNTTSRVYPFGGVSLRALFGGSLPTDFVVFVAHNIQTSTNGWHSSGHLISCTPVLAQYT